MPDAPRFSVTIPAYNAEDTLEETVASVRAQTFSDWELVICNDGSTDGTLVLAERLAAAESRIHVLSQENRGSGGAYNTAMRAARSDLLVMLSADDLLLPEHLATFDTFISEHPEASIFSCDGYYLYDDGSRVQAKANSTWGDPSRCGLTDLLHACFFDMGTVFRRDVFEAGGGFREDIYAEDYLFFLQAFARRYEHRYIDRPLSVHRRSLTQKSSAHVRMRQADIAALRTVLNSESLDDTARAIARRVIRRHRLNVAIRRVLGAVLGQDASTALIDRLRHRRAVSPTVERG